MLIPPLSVEKESSIPLSLINELRNRNVYLLVGSGTSIPFGLPSWENLIVAVFDKIQAHFPKSINYHDRNWLKKNCASFPDWTAEVLKFIPGNLFNDALKEILVDKEKADFKSYVHALICLIPFKGFVTTNFDSILEKYLAYFLLSDAKVFDYRDILSNPGKEFNIPEFPVYKIHGCIQRDIDSLILATSDYYRLQNDQRYIRFLDRLFSKNFILTIVYSLRDRDFRSFIEERYNLYENNCPLMYCVVGKTETSNMEIQLYQKKYNIQIITISENNEFAELASLLLSVFCLVYRVDSTIFGQRIIEIVSYRLGVNMMRNEIIKKEDPEIIKAQKLMAVFKEPVDIDLFTTICIDANLSFTPAHHKALFLSRNNLIHLKQIINPTRESISFIARWMSNYFNSIPLGKTSRYFSVFHKKVLREFILTISSLLTIKEGWNELIGFNDESSLKLRKFNEFFRQEGKWLEWLSIAEKADKFLNKKSPEFLELLKTKMWVLFWTRRFKEARTLLNNFPAVDEDNGQYSYKFRLQFMDKRKLPFLIKTLEAKTKLEFFNRSILGRSYSRLALSETNIKKRMALFNEAKYHLRLALKGAKIAKNPIEISVQSWYISMVFCELNDLVNAHNYLAESRRLDESIMDRKPGLAWLDLANYRLSKRDPNVSEDEIANYRNTAITSMTKLGIKDPKNYIEKDFFY